MPTSPPPTPSMYNWLSPSPPIAGRQDVATSSVPASHRPSSTPYTPTSFSSALRTGNQNVHLAPLSTLAAGGRGNRFQVSGLTKPFSSHTHVSTYNTADTVDQAPRDQRIGKPRQTTPHLHIGSEPYTSPPRLVLAIHGPCYGHPRFR